MRALRWIPLVAVFGLVACGGSHREGSIRASGRVEASEVRVASEIPGRLLEVAVDEGDPVRRGARVASLDPEASGARLERVRAAVRAAAAEVDRARSAVVVLRHHLRTAREDLARARALHEVGAASKRRVEEAEDALAETEGRLEAAEAAGRNARAASAGADAALQEAVDAHAETEVVSPLDGVVLLRLAEPGEVVGAGHPLLVVYDPGDLRLRIYVAEERIGEIRIGDPVDVVVDAFEDRVFAGEVIRVAQKAEFTPRDVHMPDERARLVFGVEVRLEDPGGFLKPGMPADAVVRATATPRMSRSRRE